MSNSIPSVSVIIPTYNRGSWIGESLESVLSQSFQDFELLVVDDGSTDDTPSIIAKFPRARYFRKNENSGVSSARNRGLQEARGRYIAFLDSDDLWQKDKLQEQVGWMETHPDCVVCYTDEIWIRKGVRVNPMTKHRKSSGDVFADCLQLCFVSASSAMMRRSLFEEVGNFDESLPVCEDYDFWLRVAMRHPIHFIPRQLMVKRGGHSDQLSNKYWGMDRFRVRALEKLLDGQSLNERYSALTREILVKKCETLSKGFAKRDKLAEAGHYRGLIEKYSSGGD